MYQNYWKELGNGIREMSKDKIIILYRHAETNMNVEDITMGQLDIDTNFTENGERQILEIGDNLLENNIQIIYSSDYKRAYETACKAVLYKKLNIPIV